MVHGQTLVRSACEREPQCMTAAGFRLDAEAEWRRGSGRRAFRALAVGIIQARYQGLAPIVRARSEHALAPPGSGREQRGNRCRALVLGV